MKISPISKWFRKMNNPGGWLVGVASLALLGRLMLAAGAAPLARPNLSLASIVNQLNVLCLLSGLLGGLYVVIRPLKRSVLAAKLATAPAEPTRRGQVLREAWQPWQALRANLPPQLFTTAGLRQRQEKLLTFVDRRRNVHPAELPHIDERLQQLGKAIETLQLGVTITDLNGKILYTNPAEASMHGYEVGELLGQDLGIFAPGELRNPMTLAQMQDLRNIRESVNIRKDGRVFPVRLTSDVVKDVAGEPIAIVTTCEDLTERKRTEAMLKHRTRELALLNRLSEMLQACRAEKDTYPVVGKICKKLFPLDAGCLSLLAEAQAQPQVVALWGQFPKPAGAEHGNNGSGRPLETESLCPRSNFYPENECLCVPINAAGDLLGMLSLCFRGGGDDFDHAGNYHQGKAKQNTLARVAEQYALALVNLRLREALRLESIRDPLTGLYNRRYMEESLEREARRAKRHHTPIGIIMLDIDHFKEVNDMHGHEAGDLVLQKLGHFLQRHTRGEDIACRYGGEEFLLIFPEAVLEVVVQRAQELHAGVKQLKISYQGQRLPITISAGVAVLPKHSVRVREVVKAADHALYRAKANGRDQVVVA